MSTSDQQSLNSTGLPKIEQILGLAVFDGLGLPCDYFITAQCKDIEWIQLTFQCLGLQQLIASAMKLPSLEHAMVRTKLGNIVLIRTNQKYLAVLIKRALPQEIPNIDEKWVEWMCQFEADIVRSHPNFQRV